MRKILAVCLLVALVIGLCACAAPGKKLVGTWKHTESVFGASVETTYVFNDDGTGKTTTLSVGVEFTYTVEKDKVVITSYPLGVKTTQEYTFDFSDGKLLLTDSANSTMVLEKVTE